MWPILFSWGSLTIYTFGVFLFLAFFGAIFLVWRKGREDHFEEEEVFSVSLWVALGGLIGARLGYVWLNFERFGFDLLLWLSVAKEAGLSFVFGFLAGLAVLRWLTYKKKWDFWQVADLGAMGLVVGQIIGWFGAFIAGTYYGRPTVNFYGVWLTPQLERRQPVPLYLVFLLLILWLVLRKCEKEYRNYGWYRKGRGEAASGFLFFSYLVGVGLSYLVVALFWEINLYSRSGLVNLIAWMLFLIIGASGLYARSARRLSEDVKKIGKSLQSVRARIG